MAQITIRYWQDSARNKQVTVTYEDLPVRRVFATVTPLDPAYPITDLGGAPRDGIASGMQLRQFCEGTTQVTLSAFGGTPFATITTLANAAVCDLSTLTLVRASGFAPLSPATTGSGEVQASGGTAPYTVSVGNGGSTFITVTANAAGLAAFPSLPPGAYTVALTDSAARPSTRTGSFVVPVLQVAGCNLPTALNYNPAATSNDGSCVFVLVDAQPAGLVAAHLPQPVLLRSAPINAQPGIVYLFIETATSTAGPWLAAGQLRQAADPVTAATAFNVSEVLKAQFTSIPAPAEAGVDPALSRLMRLRYVVQSSVGVDTYADTLLPFRVLNAAVTPPADGILTLPATPYLQQPVGAALWRNTATLASGVVAEPLPVPATGCPARCFVWLNRLGGWSSGFFTGRHVLGTDQSDPVIYRDGAGADRYAHRGQVRPTLHVYSDKLTYDTYYALRGVRDSIQVYERTSSGQYTPVLIGSGSYTEYQEQTDKTWTVDFTLSYPPALIQTQ